MPAIIDIFFKWVLYTDVEMDTVYWCRKSINQWVGYKLTLSPSLITHPVRSRMVKGRLIQSREIVLDTSTSSMSTVTEYHLHAAQNSEFPTTQLCRLATELLWFLQSNLVLKYY